MVDLDRVFCKFDKGGDCITNVRMGGGIGIEEFTKEFTVSEAHVVLERCMFFGVF
jgi:hypothetical protein